MSARPPTSAPVRRRADGFLLSNFSAKATPPAEAEAGAEVGSSYLDEIGFDFEPDDANDEVQEESAPALPEAEAEVSPSAATTAIGGDMVADMVPEANENGAAQGMASPAAFAEIPTALLARAYPPPLPAAQMPAPGDVTAMIATHFPHAAARSEEDLLLPASADNEDDLPPAGPSMPPEMDFAAGDVLPDYLDPRQAEQAEKGGRILTADDEIDDLLSAVSGGDRMGGENSGRGAPVNGASDGGTSHGPRAIAASTDANAAGGKGDPAANGEEELDAAAEAGLTADENASAPLLTPAAAATPAAHDDAGPASAVIAELKTEKPTGETALPPSPLASEDKTKLSPLPPDATWNRGKLPQPVAAEPAPIAAADELPDAEVFSDLIKGAAAASPPPPPEVELAAGGQLPPSPAKDGQTASQQLSAEEDLADLLSQAAALPANAAAAKTLAMPRVEEETGAKQEAGNVAAQQIEPAPAEEKKEENKHRDTMAILEAGLLSSSATDGKNPSAPRAAMSDSEMPSAPTPADAAATPAADDLTLLLERRNVLSTANGESAFASSLRPEAQMPEKQSAGGKIQRALAAVGWHDNWMIYCDLMAALIFTLSLAVIISHFLWQPPPIP